MESETPKPVDEQSCLLGLPHIKREGSDRCASCGCLVQDMPITPCRQPYPDSGAGI